MIVLVVPLGSILVMSMMLTPIFCTLLTIAIFLALFANLFSTANNQLKNQVSTGEVQKLYSSLKKSKILYQVKQNELYWSEEKFNQLMKHAPVGMAIMNKKGRIIESNHALVRLSGYSRKELRGKRYDDFSHQLPLEAQRHFTNFQTPKNNEVFEVQFAHKQGTLIWIQLNVSAVRDKQDKVEFLVVQLVNIDAEKKSQLAIEKLNNELEAKVQQRTIELENKNKDLENFNYAVSHDLKAPLKNIKGLTALLKEGMQGEEAKICINHITTMAVRMEKLINNLFLFSKAEQLNLHKETFDLTAILRTCFNELKNHYPHQAIDISIPPLPVAFGDQAAIRQVCENLLSNALKYASKNDKIILTITGKQKDNQLLISIKDNGIGFDETQKDKLFKCFERLHKSSEYEGTGLGLAICERIIQKHGGQIWAVNNQSKGATFHFTLPLQNQRSLRRVMNYELLFPIRR